MIIYTVFNQQYLASTYGPIHKLQSYMKNNFWLLMFNTMFKFYDSLVEYILFEISAD